MEVKYAALSEIGKVRKHNEDCFGVDEETPNGKVYVVCDGMGGHVGGATASRLAVTSILEYFKRKKYDKLIPEIDHAFQFANEQIFAHTLSEPQLKGMGTTAVVLIIRNEECYIGHVGDSRIYIKSNGKLHRITKDHSYVQSLVDNNIIKDEDAEKHPQKNQILKALGHTAEVKGTVCKKPFKVKAGDTFMLCSDGLNGMVTDSLLEGMVNEQDIEQSKVDLYEAAMQNGGLDNITVLLVTVVESKYYGKNDFKSFNPAERNNNNDDAFDKTSGFNTTQQIPGGEADSSKPKNGNQKKQILLIGLLCLALISTSILLYRAFSDKESNNIAVNENQTLTSADLESKTYDELKKVVAKKPKTSNVINGTTIQTKDNKKAVLTIVQNRLTGVEEEKKHTNPTTESSNDDKKVTGITTIDPKPEKKDTLLDCLKKKPLYISKKKDYYEIQVQDGGETVKDLMKRINGFTNTCGCTFNVTEEQIQDLNKKEIPTNEKEKITKGTKIKFPLNSIQN